MNAFAIVLTSIYYVNKLYVHVCVLERAKHSFFALPNPLSCSVMNKICLNQVCRPIAPLRYKFSLHHVSIAAAHAEAA